jgi:hypothetical protein
MTFLIDNSRSIQSDTAKWPHVVPAQFDLQFVAERLEMPAHRVGVIGDRSVARRK